MRLLKKIIQILDNTPAVYGPQNRRRGQSVVELALVTPILIVLLMGLAEIGWLANNYLILMEVTRVGARLGTTQTAETSPLAWNNKASLVPFLPNAASESATYRICALVRDPNNRELQGFYNFISCVMLQALDPLEFRDDNDVDDIVISAFSLQGIDPDADVPITPYYFGAANPRAAMAPSLVPSVLPNEPQVIVVARYPTNTNECYVNADNTANLVGIGDTRDPFDLFVNQTRDYDLKASASPDVEENRQYRELAGYDAPEDFPYPGATGKLYERQRGWALTGQHFISGTGCYGSEWTSDEIETLVNVPGFNLSGVQRDRLPNQGLVLVEIFWEHSLLLKNPIFNPVFIAFGTPDPSLPSDEYEKRYGKIVLAVWAAFPLPATEPRLTFQ